MSEMKTTAIILAADDIELLRRVAHVRVLTGKSTRASVSDVIRDLVQGARASLEAESREVRNAPKPRK